MLIHQKWLQEYPDAIIVLETLKKSGYPGTQLAMGRQKVN